MKTYTIKDGDTFEKISRRSYGTEGGASVISSANPELSGGLVTGAIIVIPDDPESVALARFAAAPGNPDEITVRVSGKEFRFWTDVRLIRSIDAVATFEFSAPFEPDNADFREVFRPLSFQPVDISIGGVRVFQGTLVQVNAEQGESRTVSVSGYSRPGVLRDCTLPAGAPVEFSDLDLRGISKAVAAPFGIGVVFREVGPGPVFDLPVAIEPSGKVMEFLIRLSHERNLVVGSTDAGNVLFWRTTSQGPRETLTEGDSPLLTVTPSFKAQDYYSHISSLTPSFFGGAGDAYTVVNKNLRGVVRPFAFKVEDTYSADSVAATEARMGRMYANALGYTISVVGLRDSEDRLWEPNTKIRLTAPGAMIYEPTEFLIRTAIAERRSGKAVTELKLVLPTSFDTAGGVPEGLPWDS